MKSSSSSEINQINTCFEVKLKGRNNGQILRKHLADRPFSDSVSKQSILNKESKELVIDGQNRKQKLEIFLVLFQIAALTKIY